MLLSQTTRERYQVVLWRHLCVVLPVRFEFIAEPDKLAVAANAPRASSPRQDSSNFCVGQKGRRDCFCVVDSCSGFFDTLLVAQVELADAVGVLEENHCRPSRTRSVVVTPAGNLIGLLLPFGLPPLQATRPSRTRSQRRPSRMRLRIFSSSSPFGAPSGNSASAASTSASAASSSSRDSIA